jgi:hypothetical protein
MPTQLLYLAADTLGMPLHEVEDHLIRGARTHELKLGFWKIHVDTLACSDELNTQEVGMVCRLKGDVWMYLIVHADGTAAGHLFDGGTLQLKSKDVAKFGMGSIKATLKKIKPLTKAVLSYNPAPGKEKWEECDVPGNLEYQA